MAESNHPIKRFVHWIAPNAAWDMVKWIGGSTVLGSIWHFFLLEYHRSSVDWIWLGVSFGAGLLLILLAARFQSKVTAKDSQNASSTALANTLAPTLREISLASGSAVLFWHYSAAAKELVEMLDRLWHHWNNAGEHLVYPLTINPSIRPLHETIALCIEHRDFKVLYGNHIEHLQQQFPSFTSRTMVYGFPSKVEYPDAITALREHAELLNKVGNDSWEARNGGTS